jgi:putative flippase GtrA
MIQRQIGRFAVSGSVGFLVDIGVLYGILQLGVGPYLGRLLSFLAAVYTTWIMNRNFTFRPQRGQSLFRECFTYFIAMSAGGVINYSAYSAVMFFFGGPTIMPALAVCVGSACGMILNFPSAKYWVYKKGRHF